MVSPMLYAHAYIRPWCRYVDCSCLLLIVLSRGFFFQFSFSLKEGLFVPDIPDFSNFIYLDKESTDGGIY